MNKLTRKISMKLREAMDYLLEIGYIADQDSFNNLSDMLRIEVKDLYRSHGKMDCTNGIYNPIMYLDRSTCLSINDTELTKTMIHELVHLLQMHDMGAKAWEKSYVEEQGKYFIRFDNKESLELEAENRANEYFIRGRK